jgi:hypothetical protein
MEHSIIWARGIVMHPKGTVSVKWELKNKHLYLSYKAPSGTKVTVAPKVILATYPITTTKTNAYLLHYNKHAYYNQSSQAQENHYLYVFRLYMAH